MSEKYKLTLLAVEGESFGKLLDRIGVEYKGEEKKTIRSILWWLRGSANKDDIIYHQKKQSGLHRKQLHRAAETLGLKHITIEFVQNRLYCTHHKKYCSYVRGCCDDRSYDSDHECSGDDSYKKYKFLLDHDDMYCVPECRVLERRHTYIISPDIDWINTEDDLTKYLSDNGYLYKPPFAYSYKCKCRCGCCDYPYLVQ